jgi:hypothetical protein
MDKIFKFVNVMIIILSLFLVSTQSQTIGKPLLSTFQISIFISYIIIIPF